MTNYSFTVSLNVTEFENQETAEKFLEFLLTLVGAFADESRIVAGIEEIPSED